MVASEAHPLAAIELAEAVATSDVPGGVVNVLTGLRSELAPVLAAHMDVNAIDVTGADGDVAALEVLAAENVKRVVRAREDREPVGDRGLHGAEDGLAPDRALKARGRSPFRRFARSPSLGHPNPPPAADSIASSPDLATDCANFVPTSYDDVGVASRRGRLPVEPSSSSTASAAASSLCSSGPSARTHGTPLARARSR